MNGVFFRIKVDPRIPFERPTPLACRPPTRPPSPSANLLFPPPQKKPSPRNRDSPGLGIARMVVPDWGELRERPGSGGLTGPERFDEANFPAAVFKEHFQPRRVVRAMMREEDLRAVLSHGADLPAAMFQGDVRVEAAKEGVPVVPRDSPARDVFTADRLKVRWRGLRRRGRNVGGGRLRRGRQVCGGRKGGRRLRDDRLP